MFHKPVRKAKSAYAKPLKDLTAIVPLSKLLSEDKRRRDLLKNISEYSAIELPRFESLCSSLIHNFTNHCQSMPETSNSYYALPGGILDHVLNRTEAALSLFRQYIVQEDGEVSEEQKLWLYALFSAGILQGMGKLQIDYRVDLYDVNGQFLKQWSPLLESMASVGSYYQFEFLPEGDENLRRRLNILIARLLMPASGYAWIISNPDVLAVWLALLNEDARSAGTLGAILVRADAIALQRYFNDLIKNAGAKSGRRTRVGTFVDSVPESVADKERNLGIEFIKWMAEKLAAGQIMINKSPLFTVPGGLLMSEEMFKLFVREHPEFKNWQAVQAAFLSLGLHSLGPDGSVISRFEQANTQQMQSGVVFAESKYGVALPEQMKIHNMHTGAVSTISAIELVHMAQFNQQHFNRQDHGTSVVALNQLSAAGQWQPAEKKSVSLQSGTTRG